MPYIHQQAGWPRFVWDSDAIASTLAGVRHRQGRLLGRLSALGFQVREQASLAALTTDVVKSAAIEGENLPEREVRSSIARRLGIDIGVKIRPRREVEGIVEMLLDATQRFSAPLTRERLFAWHSALFPQPASGKRGITSGAWRTDDTGPMQVVSGALGRERVHFEAPSAKRVPADMERFLDWINAPSGVDPVLRAGVAHLWFVTIHPFEDGNGRIARAIADLMLARGDGFSDRFYSMSSQIEAERREYYRRLEATQRGTLDITGWLDWFIQCLGRSIENADSMLSSIIFKATVWQRLNERRVNERQRVVLNRLLDGFQGSLTTRKYAALAHCSQDTALRDIRELVSWGALVQNEKGGRSTSYGVAE